MSSDTERPPTSDTNDLSPNVQKKYDTYQPNMAQNVNSANGFGMEGQRNGNVNGNGYPIQNSTSADFGMEGSHRYGGNPLAHINTGDSARLPPFAGYLEPGLYRPKKNSLANPAPLGLSAFALTTFVLSLINFQTQGVTEANVIVSLAFGYGGLVQLLAGMWEMATGNTFGATALSSYGGFWISFAILLTPGGFNIAEAYAKDTQKLEIAIGFFLIGWFIFTFLLWLLTLRSTVVFSLLFFWLWLAFLMLGIAHLITPAGGSPNVPLTKAGGMFGLLAAFFAWYVAFAGMADSSNSFFTVPVWHFPWSEKGRERRGKTTSKDSEKTV